jgi:hypothetical protein
MKKEEVFSEGTMTNIELKPHSEGGHEVHYKGEHIGDIWKGRSGAWSHFHHDSGDNGKRHQSKKAAIDAVRSAHAIDRHYQRQERNEKPLKEEDAYDKDRYAVKDGKAVKDNPGHMGSANYKDQPHHVYASSAEEALKKKSVKEGASQEDYLKEIEMAKKRAQGEGNPDLTKGKVTAVKQESVEQIDELSKDTLKSYSTKAKKDSEEYKKAGYAYDSDPDERAFAPKAFKKAASRAAGAAKADSKIKEEVVVEGSGPKEKQKTPYKDINSPEYRAAAEKQKQKMKDTTAAEPGKKMLSKMNKEDVDQIDELSKDTLKSYSAKAKKDS